MANRYIWVLFVFALAIAALMLGGISSRQQIVAVAPEPESESLQETTTATEQDKSSAIARPVLSTQSPSGRYNTKPKHDDHGHDHSHDHDIEIPVEIQAYIEKQRIPESQLIRKEVRPGVFITDFKGQYEHVSVAVRQPDGSIKIVEKQIMPLTDEEVEQRKIHDQKFK